MGTRLMIFIISIAVIAVMTSCSNLERNWGKSFTKIRQSQTLNPEAGKNKKPVVGLGGTTAKNTMNAYQNSFGDCNKTEETVNVIKLR